MSRVVTSIRILKDLKDEAHEAALKGEYPGASSFSAMVEMALDKLLHPEEYPIENMELEVPA